MRFGPYFAKLNNEFEDKDGGLVTEAYLDPNGIPTGPGGSITNRDGSPVQMGQTWTEAEALQLYADKQLKFAEDVWDLISTNIRPQLKQHQFDALGVLAWNIGVSAFADSSVLRLVNEGRFDEAAAAFLLWRRMTLRGGSTGPDGLPARDPQGRPLAKGFSWFRASRGIYRRSISAALLFAGHNWKNAAAVNKIVLQSYPVFVEAENKWMDKITNEMEWKDILAEARNDPLPVIEGKAEDEPSSDYITDPTPETPLTTADLNNMQAESLRTGKKILLTPMTKKVPVEAVEYLDEADKQPGNITVKRIEDSRRGRGYAKSEMGKTVGIVGAGGSAAAAIGAAEPVVKFVDKYPASTIAYVFFGLMLLAVVLYFYGKWERERGEDEAEDLLG